MCIFVSRPMKIVTFLLKNADPPKRVVDFPLERDTFRNKIMEIVEDFSCESIVFHFSFFFHHFSTFFRFFRFFIFSLKKMVIFYFFLIFFICFFFAFFSFFLFDFFFF